MMNNVVYLDERFYIKELSINTPGIRNILLESQELIIDAFADDPAILYLYGHEYDMREHALEYIFASENDCKRRLSKFIKQARMRQDLVFSMADRYYRRCIIPPGYRVWVVYDSQHPNGQRMAGFCTIADMRRKELKMSLWKSAYVRLLTAWHGIKDYFRFFWNKEYPTLNSRLPTFLKFLHEHTDLVEESQEVVDRLARLPDEKLAYEVYPHSYHYYVEMVAVSIFYQHRGIGTKMLRHAISEIPRDKKPEFVSSDGQFRSQGKLRLHLTASHPGMPLYEKLGFKVVHEDGKEFSAELEGHTLYCTSMVLDLD